jgi:hypothetical protein
MVSEKTDIAFCGLNCSDCPVYRATLSGHEPSRNKIADEWSKVYNTVITPGEINCLGCRSKTGKHFSHCFECSIRLCALERRVQTCADCSEYACVDLVEFFKLVPVSERNLEDIRGDASSGE